MLDSRLVHVVAVAQSGSFTKAAERVGLTQSGITKSIADLEREIGHAIFYRTARGALLTEEGRDFVERAARLLEDARTLLKGNGDRDDPYAGILRIGVCPASLEWLLVEPLAILLSKHAGIRFEITGGTFERMVQLLRRGSVDVAIGFDAAFAEWSDLRREPIAKLDTVLFVRKGHPILERTKVSTADIANFDFISPSDSRPYGMTIREFYESQGIQWQKHLHIVDYFPIVKRLVATSDAIGITTAGFSESPAFAARFERIIGVDPFPATLMCCAIRSRWDPKPSARAFLRVMREKFPRESA